MNLITPNLKSYLNFKVIKRLGSYFWDTRVTIRQSILNGRLEVWYQEGKPLLTSENTTYSYGSLHQTFKQIFKQIEIAQKPIESVLILGFGVGSMASVLLEDLELNCKIDAVEYDPEILRLGQRYFNTQRFQNHLNIFQEDALSYVAACIERYDLILVDLFQDTEVPIQFQTSFFIQKICKLTQSGGSVIFNKITSTGIQIEQFRSLLLLFQAQAGKSHTFSILGKNQVIVWEKP